MATTLIHQKIKTNLHHLISTEENLTYQNLKIWHFTNNLMILEFGDGSRVEFGKLGE